MCGAQINFRFADSTAQWHVWEHGHNVDNIHIYSVKGDTVIGGLNYQIIGDPRWNSFFHRDSLNHIYMLDWAQPLVFDFSKQAGDTIRDLNLSLCGIVDSVDSVLIGHYRKRMFVFWGDYCSSDGIIDVWVDGIGSMSGNTLFPYPPPFGQQDPTIFELVCFSENNQTIYHHPNRDCFGNPIPTGISEIRNSQSAIRIAPNPATTNITLQLQQTHATSTTFQLFDITGRMILQKPLTETTNRIELSGVSKGMYLYNVVSDKERLGAGKLIVEQ